MNVCMYIFVYLYSYESMNLFLLLFVISGDTEKQTKSCPRRYLKSPQKESLETSWELQKRQTNIKKVVLGQNRNITKKYKNQIEKQNDSKAPLFVT